MSDDGMSGFATRAQPVADAPVDELIGRADALAKRWAAALIAARRLEEIDRVPLAQIALQAPDACAAILHALRSNRALDELAEPSADGRSAGALAFLGVGDAREAVAAVEALRGVLWDGILGALAAAGPGPAAARVIGDLSDRLAFVCAVVLSRSLPEAQGRSRVLAEAPAPARSGAGTVRARRATPPSSALSPSSAPPMRARRTRAVLVDEHIEDPSSDSPLAARAGARARGRDRARDSRPAGRALPWDIPLAADADRVAGPAAAGGEDRAWNGAEGRPISPSAREGPAS